jgi:hypothetical protein
MTASIIGTRRSDWPRDMASKRRARTAPSRQTAAEQAVPAVSKASRQRARSEYLASIVEIQARRAWSKAGAGYMTARTSCTSGM